ncbi:MAG TPA: urea ABC transporter ATP-binding subunit UrtE [Polyangia bacterium]
MLDASGVNQFYGESHTLWDAGLVVPKGSVVCLMGRNGVGKTTLLKVIMGLLVPVSGKMMIGPRKLPSGRPELRARMGIGYVPQGREIFPQLTVEENLRLGLTASGKNEIPKRVFEMFPVLKKMLGRRGGDLSGGQQQQLAIGRALGSDPSVLILDEPTEGIQPNIVHEIGDIIVSLAKEGLAVLLVEQKLPFARRVGNVFCIMDRGRTVAEGKMADLNDELVRRHLNV